MIIMPNVTIPPGSKVVVCGKWSAHPSDAWIKARFSEYGTVIVELGASQEFGAGTKTFVLITEDTMLAYFLYHACLASGASSAIVISTADIGGLPSEWIITAEKSVMAAEELRENIAQAGLGALESAGAIAGFGAWFAHNLPIIVGVVGGAAIVGGIVWMLSSHSKIATVGGAAAGGVAGGAIASQTTGAGVAAAGAAAAGL